MKKQRNSTCSKLNKNRTPTLSYSLGFQKIEGTKTADVIHHTRREGHSGLNHTIKPCISEWRNKEIQLARNWTKIALRHWAIALDSKKLKVPRQQMLYTTHVEKVIVVSTIPSNLALDAPVNEETTCSKLNKNRTPTSTLGYNLGIQKIEGTKTPNVIHHTRGKGHSGLNHTIKPCIGCSSEWRNKDARNWTKIALRHWAIALDSKKLKVPRHQMLYTTHVEKVIVVSTIPSNLALDAPVNEETKMLETEQKLHSDTGL